MNYKELAEQALDYIVEQRRWCHQNPELSLEEVQTTEHIAAELQKNGLYRDPTLPGPYRIMCDAAGGKGRKGVQNCGSPGGY